MGEKLYRDSRTALAFAYAGDEEAVTVLLVVDVGRLDDMLDHVSRLGGTVVRQHDGIGYLRVSVSPRRVDELTSHAAVDTASVLFVHDFTPRRATLSGEVGTHPAPATSPTGVSRAEKPSHRLPRLPDPIATPYSPLADIDAAGFLQRHSTFDGRGVTVGIVDGFIDQLLPEFQTATDIDGRPVPKILDCVNPMDPAIDGGPEWVRDWRLVMAK